MQIVALDQTHRIDESAFAVAFRISQRISVKDDFQKIGEIPCARNSLLSGIASGLGIGAIRAMSTSELAIAVIFSIYAYCII